MTLPPDVTQDEIKRLKVLRSYCEHLDVITDRLFMFDVDNVVDDPRFFVFEEEVQEVIMCFSRDDWVRSNASYEVHLPMLSLVDPAVAGSCEDLAVAGSCEVAADRFSVPYTISPTNFWTTSLPALPSTFSTLMRMLIETSFRRSPIESLQLRI